MGNNVFSNGREISCKAGDGKSICAFPDVCMTPPENPATPPGVPVPYPNTGFAKDTTSGSKTVKVSGKEVMLKNKSYFKKSTGDEAGCAAKKGVITSVNRGKVYFNAWSMDVKFEGENIVRHLDLTTHNHASQTGQTPPFPHADTMAVVPTAPCTEHDVKCAIKKCDNQKHDIRRTRSGNPMPPSSRCSALGSKKHACVGRTLKAKGCQSEKTFKMRPPPPTPATGRLKRGQGRRPDVVIGGPPPNPYDVYDAKFPCSHRVSSGRKQKGVMPSRGVTGAGYLRSARRRVQRQMRAYQRIANGGKVKALTPEDCKQEKCP